MNSKDSSTTFYSMKSVSVNIAAQMGWKKEEALWTLIRLWQETFGDPVARVSYPLSIGPKEMAIACESALWKRELTFLLPEIRSRLSEVDPVAAGKEIVFRTVRPFSHPLKNRAPARGPSPEQIDALWIRAGKISSALPDPLKSRGQVFVFRQMVNGTHLDRNPPCDGEKPLPTDLPHATMNPRPKN